jgi:hypothetical protein
MLSPPFYCNVGNPKVAQSQNTEPKTNNKANPRHLTILTIVSTGIGLFIVFFLFRPFSKLFHDDPYRAIVDKSQASTKRKAIENSVGIASNYILIRCNTRTVCAS